MGVKLGLLKEKTSLNERDKLIGHERVYTPEVFLHHIKRAGLKIIRFGGSMVKPFDNRYIEKNWSQDIIDAFFAISEEMPQFCSEIYGVAERMT